jgi:hypothetical protein
MASVTVPGGPSGPLDTMTFGNQFSQGIAEQISNASGCSQLLAGGLTITTTAGECRLLRLPRLVRAGSTNSSSLPAASTPYRQDNRAPITL